MTLDLHANKPFPCACGLVAQHLTTSRKAHASSGDDAKYYLPPLSSVEIVLLSEFMATQGDRNGDCTRQGLNMAVGVQG